MALRRRTLILALAWLATCAGSGFLGAFLSGERRGTSGASVGHFDEGSSSQPPPVPREPGVAPSAPPDANAAGTAPLPAALPAPAARPRLLVPASLEVEVLVPEGSEAPEGTVYALGPGEPGGNHEEMLAHAEYDPPGPALLRVPGPGTYDVGFSCPRGSVLQADVPVGPGSPSRVTLRLPGEALIAVRCDPPWPPPGNDLQVEVHFAPEDGLPEVAYPGRGQTGKSKTTLVLGPTGEGATVLLPRDRLFGVRAVAYETLPSLPIVFRLSGMGKGPGTLVTGPVAEGRCVSPRYRLEPVPAAVRPGGTVRLALRRLAVLDVVVEAEGFPPSAPDVAGWFDLHCGEARKREVIRCLRRAPSAADGEEVPPGLLGYGRFEVEASTAALRWSGRGVQSGSLENLALRPGEIERVVVRLRPDPAGREPEDAHGGGGPGPAAEEGVPLTIGGLPEGFDGSVWAVAAWTDVADGNPENRFRESLEGGPPFLLPARFRTARTLRLSVGDSLASADVPVPAEGPVHADLRPAGHLLVAPDVLPPEEFGWLTLRLPGGRILPTSVDGDVFAARATPGQLIGPLPEGAYAFEVRLGGVRLPDAAATVRAGRIEVLRVRTGTD